MFIARFFVKLHEIELMLITRRAGQLSLLIKEQIREIRHSFLNKDTSVSAESRFYQVCYAFVLFCVVQHILISSYVVHLTPKRI